MPFRNFSSETLLSIIHQGKVAFWSWDPETEIAYLDPLARRFWGVDTDAIDMSQLWSWINADHRDRTVAAWRESAATSGPYEFVFQIERADDTPLWIAARGSGEMARSPNGEVPAIFVDVTEEENARIIQHTLLREMGHRISNLFAVTGGILQLTRTKHTDVGSFSAELGQRFAQLSTAYRTIMRSPGSDDGSAAVAKAIRALLEPFGLRDDQMSFDLDPAPRIDQNDITSLALILHELMTNAMKYGALANNTGRLQIDFASDGESYVFRWREIGSETEIDENKITSGFGERLIRQTAQMAFAAEITRSFPPEGLLFEMMIPRKALQ